ncbi:unnamed protein product [Didymodactylos carnosus]|uniref:MULE transposase domain-containing protein n=1 Tax=Didymodactylos carnosus TaxID=1234261 RepID=A0A8S2SSM7_9BILA|nr:unnamed protein product [Didymodactylos carnosus]CAF4249014.1 unnamed protein product [Didymodactylos carnosus]
MKQQPVFGTLSSLQQLCSSDHLFMDGTLSSCPSPFYQLYTIHSYNNQISTPKFYSLLADKNQGTYTHLLAAIQRICYENQLIINPKYITIDFETAMINSLNMIFPNATIKGFNFHFNKCLYKHLQVLGFQSAFNNAESTDINDINVRNLYRKTASLAFMPPNQIPDLWVQIVNDFNKFKILNHFLIILQQHG